MLRFLGATLLAVSAVSQASVQEAARKASDKDTIPLILEGRWAPNSQACTDVDAADVITVSSSGVSGYEFTAHLIKHAGFNNRAALSGKDARYLTMLVAESGEARVGFGRIALGLVGDRLYVERPTDPITEVGGKVRINDTTPGLVRCR